MKLKDTPKLETVPAKLWYSEPSPPDERIIVKPEPGLGAAPVACWTPAITRSGGLLVDMDAVDGLLTAYAVASGSGGGRVEGIDVIGAAYREDF